MKRLWLVMVLCWGALPVAAEEPPLPWVESAPPFYANYRLFLAGPSFDWFDVCCVYIRPEVSQAYAEPCFFDYTPISWMATHRDAQGTATGYTIHKVYSTWTLTPIEGAWQLALTQPTPDAKVWGPDHQSYPCTAVVPHPPPTAEQYRRRMERP